MRLPCKKLHPDAKIPQRAYASDAGLDLFLPENVFLEPGEHKVVGTGIAIEIPLGYVGILKERSSTGKDGLFVMGGVIDSGYRGEIKILVKNTTNSVKVRYKGDSIAQLLILPIAHFFPEWVNELSSSERKDRGFGSSDGKTKN